MIATTHPTTILQTDFYQFTMSYAYLMSGKAGEIAGFESFVRRIKPEVSKDNFYIFKGKEEIDVFMNSVKREINQSDFFDRFWEIFSPKFKQSKEEVDRFYNQAKNIFDNIDKTFEYTVVENGTKVFPMVPVFQFRGPRIIGQMIETPITNIINGQTGFESFKNSYQDKNIIKSIEQVFNSFEDEEYNNKLVKKAIEYRKATSKVLFEAGYRRSPNFSVACNASKIAVENGWDGTSNTCLYNNIDIDLIGGTMAHAFVMSFDTEDEAYIMWNLIFPNSTILIDTYDSIEAIKKMIKLYIRPVAVRIDSDPIEETAKEVRKLLDEAGWTEVKIFLSGDITPEKLIKWEKENIPFDMCMAGTKYVNIEEMKHVNAGFVYKIVEFEKNGKKYFPFKKAFGKSNYPGLKTVNVDEEGNIIMTINQKIGFNNMNKTSENAKVSFVSDLF